MGSGKSTLNHVKKECRAAAPSRDVRKDRNYSAAQVQTLVPQWTSQGAVFDEDAEPESSRRCPAPAPRATSFLAYVSEDWLEVAADSESHLALGAPLMPAGPSCASTAAAVSLDGHQLTPPSSLGLQSLLSAAAVSGTYGGGTAAERAADSTDDEECQQQDQQQRRQQPGPARDAAGKLADMLGEASREAAVPQFDYSGAVGELEITADGTPSRGWVPQEPHNLLQRGPPIPANSDERDRTIRALNLMELPPCPEIDKILQLMRQLYGAEVSNFHLFSQGKSMVKNGCGMPPGPQPWQHGCCPWVVLSANAEVLCVPDMTRDVRFADNIWVQNGMRSYASAPLIASNGHRLGTICFASTRVIQLDAGKCRMLANFAELAVRQLEKHARLETLLKTNAEMQHVYQQMLRSLDTLNSAIMFADLGKENWAPLYVTPAFTEATGVDREAATACSLRDLLVPAGNAKGFWRALDRLKASGRAFTVKEMRLSLGAPEDTRTFNLEFRPAERDTVDAAALPVGVPAFFAHVAPEQRSQLYFVNFRPAVMERHVSNKGVTMAGSPRRDQAFNVEGFPLPGGLELRQLLGRGAHAAVYFGTWNGTEIAVKVIDREDMSPEEWEQAMTELDVGKDLDHPLLVKTLDFQVVKKYPRTTIDYSSEFTGSDYIIASDSFTCSDISCDYLGPSVTSARLSSCDSAFTSWTGSPGGLPHNSPGFDLAPACAAFQVPFDERSSLLDVDSGYDVCSSHGSRSLQGSDSANSDRRRSARAAWKGVSVWLIMEFAERGCLQDAINQGMLRTGPSLRFDQPHRLKIRATALDVASAMCYLHSHGVVHGDLTTNNVLLMDAPEQHTRTGRDFVCKVADFGCSQRLGPADLLRVNSYGSVSHMAPEVLQHSVISKAADVYSFGVLMWQMWCSMPPWAGLRHVQIMHAVVVEHQKLSFPKGAWEAYRALSLRCMSYEANDRPTFGQVCEALQRMRVTEEDVEGTF